MKISDRLPILLQERRGRLVRPNASHCPVGASTLGHLSARITVAWLSKASKGVGCGSCSVLSGVQATPSPWFLLRMFCRMPGTRWPHA